MRSRLGLCPAKGPLRDGACRGPRPGPRPVPGPCPGPRAGPVPGLPGPCPARARGPCRVPGPCRAAWPVPGPCPGARAECRAACRARAGPRARSAFTVPEPPCPPSPTPVPGPHRRAGALPEMGGASHARRISPPSSRFGGRAVSLAATLGHRWALVAFDSENSAIKFHALAAPQRGTRAKRARPPTGSSQPR